MTKHFKVRVTDPVANSSLGAGEEVVQDGNLVAEEHKTVNQMGADEAGATGDENALALRRREEFDRREAREGCVGDGLGVWVVDGLGLVRAVSTSELGVFRFLFLLLAAVALYGGGRVHIVWPEVKRPEDVEWDLAVETETLEPDGVDYITILV